MRPELEELTKQKWYTQGFAARPIFLVGVCSIDTMQKSLGFSYKTIFMNYKHDYCQFNYSEKDFAAHAELILKKLAQNPNYLKEKRTQYEQQIKQFDPLLQQTQSLRKLSDTELLERVTKLEQALEVYAGLAHLIEGISLRLEHDIRHFVQKKASGTELNHDFSILTSPVTQSFLNQKEEALWKLKNTPAGQKQKAAEQFVSNFYWVTSSYSGNIPLTVDMALDEAAHVQRFEKPDFEKLKKQKEKLFKKYGFLENQKKWIHWAEFLTDWQDNRKKNIFKGIYYLDLVLHEISRRFQIQPKHLHYLVSQDITLQSLTDKSAEKRAQKRYNGVVFVKKLGKLQIVDGLEFAEFEKALHQHHDEVELIMGNAASLGVATGPVKICTTIESLKKVQEGDILVASMTRPEYVSAMKKAAGIITDEGGVTCHAAIVSRELGIPCVIGTRNATKVLKDGWIVQVKASHGQVWVLEKKESK